MGTGCFNSQQNQSNEYNNYGNKIINNKESISSAYIIKILKIQASIKRYLAQKNFEKKIEILSKKLIKNFENKKLLNTEIITNSKSEQYYQKLLNSNKIKPYSEYINSNPKIISKLKIMAKYTIEIPSYIVTSSKEAYKGSWNLNKKYHGYGVIYQFNNVTEKERRIEGIFYDGILNGYGRIIISDEEMIRGDFALNKLNGLGEYHRKDGSIYSGSFYGGYPQGNGRETFIDESFFEGYYFKGKKKYGKFIWKNKNSYEGNFDNDLFNGKGIYKWGDKKMYDGNWKDGKMNGKGKLTFYDGSYYEGDFVDGLKEGKGIYVWKKNYCYNGEWKNDKQNGYGIFYKNGQKLKGIWENGKLKNENISSRLSFKRVYSTDKMQNEKINNNGNRFTYTKNLEMMTRISGDKKSEMFYGKVNEDKNENRNKQNIQKQKTIRNNSSSVYSINSVLMEEKKDKNDENE